MTLVTLSSGPQVTTDFVITWDARIPNSPAPCSARLWTMSRSEISPRNVVPSWLTTRAPMPLDRSSQTIVEIVVSGNVVATLSPLALRIDAMFMMPTGRGGDAHGGTQDLHPSHQRVLAAAVGLEDR